MPTGQRSSSAADDVTGKTRGPHRRQPMRDEECTVLVHVVAAGGACVLAGSGPGGRASDAGAGAGWLRHRDATRRRMPPGAAAVCSSRHPPGTSL